MSPRNLFFLILSLPLLFFGILFVTDPGDNILITKSDLSITPSGTYIVGEVKNMKQDKSFENVSIKTIVIDVDGRKETTINIGRLEPRETTDFKSQAFKEVADYKLTVYSPDNIRPSWLGACASTFCW